MWRTEKTCMWRKKKKFEKVWGMHVEFRDCNAINAVVTICTFVTSKLHLKTSAKHASFKWYHSHTRLCFVLASPQRLCIKKFRFVSEHKRQGKYLSSKRSQAGVSELKVLRTSFAFTHFMSLTSPHIVAGVGCCYTARQFKKKLLDYRSSILWKGE